MRRECRERFPRTPRVCYPDMHHGTCVTHVPWCMPGSLTRGFLCCRWRGKRSWHSRRMCNRQFYVSGKRPMHTITPTTPRILRDAIITHWFTSLGAPLIQHQPTCQHLISVKWNHRRKNCSSAFSAMDSHTTRGVLTCYCKCCICHDVFCRMMFIRTTHIAIGWGLFLWQYVSFKLGVWASYQIRKIAGCACAGNISPATDFKGNR